MFKLISFLLIENIILLTSLSLESHQDLIDIDYSVMEAKINILASFGKPSQQVLIPVDLMNHFTWISDKLFNARQSDTSTYIDEDTLSIKGIIVFAILLKDRFQLKNKYTIPQLYFFYIKTKSVLNSPGSIGLAFFTSSSNLNVIQQLYQEQLISYKQFAFVPTNLKVGKVLFGNVTSHISFNQNRYYSECKVDMQVRQWGCNLNFIKINDEIVYDNVTYVQFASEYKGMFISEEFYKIIKEKIFNNYLDRNKCKEIKDNTNMKIRCNCGDIKNFPKITFHLGSGYFVFDWKKLFIEISDDFCYFIMMLHNSEVKKHSIEWVFGHDFWLNYITVFDYEKQETRFYSNEDLTLNKNSIRINLYMERKLQIIKMNISIMIIYLIIILLYKYSLFKKT